jgi:hypothetical protein
MDRRTWKRRLTSLRLSKPVGEFCCWGIYKK